MIEAVLQLCTQNYTLSIVMLGVTMLGMTCGLVGTLLFLRGNSLCADALSHAALPGVVAAFLLMQTKQSPLVMVAGVISSGIAALFALLIQRNTTLKIDTVLALVLSVFFGAGLVLITVAQKVSMPNQTALNTYIFGAAATLMPYDICAIAVVSVGCLVCIMCFWKGLSLLVFDPVFAQTLGYNLMFYDVMLLLVLLLLIAVGLQTVGVILMSALLIAPAVAARQWTQRMPRMALCASFFGALASSIGTFISCYVHHLPTGPVIVITITAIACASFCLTPSRVS